MTQVWGIVVAGGRGERFGERKQFLPIGNARMVDHAVNAAISGCDHVVVVLPPDTEWDGPPVTAAVSGGATRAASVRAGLRAVPADAEIVVVHDAARPLAGPGLFHAVVDAVRAGADGAIPGVAVADTLKRVEGDIVTVTVPREGLVQGQTPQAFRADRLRAAHASTSSFGRRHRLRLLRRRSAKPPLPRDATDDAALIEAAGGKVVVVPGDARNLKVTTAEDLAVATVLLTPR